MCVRVCGTEGERKGLTSLRNKFADADARATSEKGKTNGVKMEPTVFPFCERGDFCCVTGRERKGVLGPPPTVGGQNREKQKTLQYSLVWNGLEVGCGGAGCGGMVLYQGESTGLKQNSGHNKVSVLTR